MTEFEKTKSDNINISEAALFLERNHFIYYDIDFDKEVKSFIHEMEVGLKGDGMLPMIPTYINGDLTTVANKKVITADIGGTNLRIAIVEIKDNDTVVSNIYKSRLPGIDKEINFDTFIDVLATSIIPYLKYSNMIAFSFAHQVKHNSKLDGYVIDLSKELRIEGIKGKPLAYSLKSCLAEHGYKDVEVVLINDTVGVAGSMMHISDEFSSFLGVVMGTGVNSAYLEDCKNIEKISDSKNDTMFINTESANFIPSFLSDFDKEYITFTKRPNAAIMEKMVAGRYLGELFYFIVKKACEAGLFSEEFKNGIKEYDSIDTKQMSTFYADVNAENIYSELCKNEKDKEVLSFICEKLIHRAANLIAIMIISIAKKAVKKDDKPVCCIIEGTTYYGLKGFDEMVKSAVNKNSKELEIKIYSVEDAALKGIGNIGISLLK
ncbi:MAG: hypothetical protein JJE03_02700 [Peptostreptococcaceae bacterium]|nr:hypothetical protein [Peptostreptococcaceae bacterium]